MKIIVLGNQGGVPSKTDNCIGYLIIEKDTKILLECGSGCIRELQKYINLEELDAVIISHTHYDHISDLFSLKYAYEVMSNFSDKFRKLNIYIPFDEKIIPLIESKMFNITYLKEGVCPIKNIWVTFKKLYHNIDTYGMLFKSGETSLGYTADTGYNTNLISFFKDCTSLLGESSLLESQKDNTPYHMTTKEVMELANQTKVDKLIITHFWYNTKPSVYLKECKKYNNKNIEVLIAKNTIDI